MSYISGGNSVTSADSAEVGPGLRKQVWPGVTRRDSESQRVVPDLYRRVIDTVALAVLFPLLYLAALALDWQDRKTAVRP